MKLKVFCKILKIHWSAVGPLCKLQNSKQITKSKHYSLPKIDKTIDKLKGMRFINPKPGKWILANPNK